MMMVLYLEDKVEVTLFLCSQKRRYSVSWQFRVLLLIKFSNSLFPTWKNDTSFVSIYQEIPDGNWYCTYCTCRTFGDLVIDKKASDAYDSLQCAQCEHKLRLCTYNSPLTPKWWEPHAPSYPYYLDDFFEKKIKKKWRYQTLGFVVRIVRRSDFARLNFQGFYTVVLEKRDVLISVASVRKKIMVHGTTVGEMSLIATCGQYCRQGICRILASAIEEAHFGCRRKIVKAAIPDLVETWTKGFGFIPIDDNEKQRLKKINLMVFPGTVLLDKPLYQKDKSEESEPVDGENHLHCKAGCDIITDNNEQLSAHDNKQIIQLTVSGGSDKSIKENNM
ncbi:hypothetical protein TanjilG_26942 [Lupinus angustifolius]|uniref:Increased DNA methylation 1 C-terminal domain-containing protein n=1 Tax=Lupinus angustifolius TaxID=3871 RepID=A0A4P1RIL4_LUPAN|nr:hypothetical protein TanjilG_26942 [Lupinus angustifolius]